MYRDVLMNRIDALLAVVFVAVIATLAVMGQNPPDVPEAPPLDQFSAKRAMKHVERIAREPHVTGSPAAAKVREYLMAELKNLGVEPRILKSPEMPGESVFARIPGKGKGKAVMLSAHYDSAPEGPGAGDDAAAVGAILETVRALKWNDGPQLENDVLVLITDAEEVGFCGAYTFASDPAKRDLVGLVMNFEARGSRGPSFLFETSEGNGWMIREFARAAPHPMATSLAGAVYAIMPNKTDFTMFKGVGLKGLNFAFVEGVENYHQPTDTVANLDERSVQHHGSYALALARHFGNKNLALAASEPNAIYFNVIGPWLLVYPGWWVSPLMVAALAAFVGVVEIGRRRGRVTDNGLMIGIALGLLAVVLAAGGAWSAWTQIQRFRVPVGRKLYQGSPEIAAALACLGIMATLCVYLPAFTRVRLTDLALGGLFWWLVGTVATSMFLPGASYLFLWPLVFGLIAMAVVVISPRPGSPAVRVASYLGAIPALFLIPPTLKAFCIALGPTLPYGAAPLAALMILALLPMLAKITAAFGVAERVADPTKAAVPTLEAI
ncbi:MAG: hypothetical protein JWN86_3342 [Planctomycetota bacterium]|nr:hypothetical protein [Planctomycetota bacterium]